MYTGHYTCQRCLCSKEPHFYACHHTHPQNSLMRLECGMLLPSTHLPGAFLASLLAGTFQIELMLTGPQGFEASWALDMSPHCAPSTQHLYHRQPPDSARWRVSHPCPPRDLAGSLLSPYCSVTHRGRLLDALALPGVLLRLVIDRPVNIPNPSCSHSRDGKVLWRVSSCGCAGQVNALALPTMSLALAVVSARCLFPVDGSWSVFLLQATSALPDGWS